MIASWGENGNFPSISFILLQRHHHCLPFDQCLIYSVPCLVLVFSGYISSLEILCRTWKSDDKETRKNLSMPLIKEVTMTGQLKERKGRERKDDKRSIQWHDNVIRFHVDSLDVSFVFPFFFLLLLHLFPFFMSNILTSLLHQHHHRNDYVIAFMW